MTSTWRIGALALTVAVAMAAVPATAAGAQPIVIKLDNFERGSWQQSPSDWHPVCMALGLGTMLREEKPKARVTLFLNLGAVFLADAAESLGDKNCGVMMGTVASKWAAFLNAGGTVVVCPGCASVAGLSAGSLRQGATLGTMDEVHHLFVKAAKVIDY